MQSSDLFWVDFLDSAYLVSLHWSYVGHNIKRQAGFPLQQACVLKTGDKRGSERLTERRWGRDIEGWERRGTSQNNEMRRWRGGRSGDEGREEKISKSNDIQPPKVLPSLAHLLPPAAQRSAILWEIQWPLSANFDVNFAWFVWLLHCGGEERDRIESERERQRAWTVFLKLGQSLSRNVDSCSRFQPFPGGASLPAACMPARPVRCLPCCLHCPGLLSVSCSSAVWYYVYIRISTKILIID